MSEELERRLRDARPMPWDDDLADMCTEAADTLKRYREALIEVEHAESKEIAKRIARKALTP